MSVARMDVLVVSADSGAAREAVDLLSRYGFAASAAGGGEDAVRAAATPAPDVVVIDLVHPGVDGPALARSIRDRAEGKQPLLVALTEPDAAADGNWDTADAGVDLHLPGPAHPVLLVGVLARFRRVLGLPPPEHLLCGGPEAFPPAAPRHLAGSGRGGTGA